MRLRRIPFAYWLGLLTFFSLLLRVPYWDVIPASYDELNTTVHGFLIAQGKMLPLVGDDAYAGPFYPYLLAGLFVLGLDNPMIGRVVIMITGVLTIPVTYAWVYALSRNKAAAFIAAVLVATNPDLILVNSHIGGASFLVPFFTTLFLYLLTEALRRAHLGWLVLAAVPGGLALQSNPISVLVIVSGLLWILWKTRGHERLGRRWPMWGMVTGLAVCLIYSPVIIYNIATQLDTVSVVQERSYLWEDNPTVYTTGNNLKRLSLQTARQVSGIVVGSETARALVGIPLVFVLLMVAGLIYTTRYVSALPFIILLPFWLLLPVVSSHYGFLSVGRFTTQLVPVWTAVIGMFLAAGIDRRQQVARGAAGWALTVSVVLVLCLGLWHVRSLFNYYEFANRTHISGWDILELSRYVVRENNGERIYISAIDDLSYLDGVPYVPKAVFVIGDIYHEFLPAQQIIGRLFEHSEPAFLLLSDHDAVIVSQTAALTWLDIPANEEARQRQYGLYRFDARTPLVKPEFVLSREEVPLAHLGEGTAFGGSVMLTGCDVPAAAAAGERFTFYCYWQKQDQVPHDTYIGFAHLFDPAAGTLVTQDDHLLGQERYPLNAWQRQEIIRESYTLEIPASASPGAYQLLLGIYTWPSLDRLTVQDGVDNSVRFPLQVR